MGIFIFFKNLCFLSKFINFFFQWKLKVHTFRILSCARRRAHTRAPILLWMLEIYWKFQDRKIFRKCDFGARACARACAHDKIWKVWTLSFHWKKKLLNLDKNLRFWRKLKFVNSNFFEAFSKNDMSTQNANKICIKMTKLFSKNSWSFHEFSK